MKIIEANEGQKISYSTTKTWLNVGDQIMLNLKKYEADNDVHIDITSDMAGNLETGVGLLYALNSNLILLILITLRKHMIDIII